MRLREFDYSLPGAYFLTVCTKSRRQILSTIHEGCTILSAVGRICETQLLLLEERYPVRIERHVIMPNHVHMLLSLYRAEQSPAPTENKSGQAPIFSDYCRCTAIRPENHLHFVLHDRKMTAAIPRFPAYAFLY